MYLQLKQILHKKKVVITLNKQEENIVDIITLDAIEDIVDIFLQHTINTEDTVGLIANKELIEYAMSEALSNDWINARKVDLEADKDIEYMISVDHDGNLVVHPVEYYDDKYFADIQYAFVSMDEDVQQTTIDNLLDRDISVILFGYDEASVYEDNYTVNGESVSKDEFDRFVSKFKTISDNDSSTYNITTIKGNLVLSDIEDIIENIGNGLTYINEVLDEMNQFKQLFGW